MYIRLFRKKIFVECRRTSVKFVSEFEYSIMKLKVESLKRKFESLLIILSPTEKEANRRGSWFIHKCKNAKVADYGSV